MSVHTVLGDAQPSARPPGRGAENGQGVPQQVAGARKLVERLCVEPDQLLRPALPEPVEMTGVAGTTLMTLIESAQSCSVKLLTGDGCLL